MIYVASSWRNGYQPFVVDALRGAGHEVYDFRNPTDGNHGFQWSEIDALWGEWTTDEYIGALQHPVAESGFKHDMTALEACEDVVLVLPCGASAHSEAGWAAGAGKRVFVLIPTRSEPELLYKMFSGGIHSSIDTIIRAFIPATEVRGA